MIKIKNYSGIEWRNLLKNNGVPGEDEKETLVKHILEQQDTIGEQQAEINELSSQNKEEVNE